MAKVKQNFSKAEARTLKEVIELIRQALGKRVSYKLLPIEYPPKGQMGDYSVPCFLLAKRLKKSPAEIASQLAGTIKPTELVNKVVATGPYLNFFVDRKIYGQLALSQIAKVKGKFGRSKIGSGQKVMVEFFSPNTNKPLTIGHLRNIFLGSSLVRLFEFSNYKVISASLYNDRGIAIAKAILGYQKWGQGKTPKNTEQKPDHFVGNFYTQFCQAEKNDANLSTEAKRVLLNWEKDDKEIRAVWQTLMTWVLEGFKQTLAKLGIEKFDEEYYESEFYQSGKDMVEKGLKQGVFVKNAEGVVLAPLEKYGLPDKIVLRPDDTSLYVTQDLSLAHLKNKLGLDQSIHVVGSEQDLYFKQLFKILELLGFANASHYHHLSYGMIRLPEGKIKSREGLVSGTGADDLISQLEELAKAEVKKRAADLPEKELNERAGQIALAALKYYILTVNPQTTMIFEPQKSIAFAGQTGPYLQYVIARINSIFAKTKIKPTTKVDYSLLSSEVEFALIKLLARFPKIINDAVVEYNPAILANYLFDLASAFSSFYEHQPVLKAESEVEKARILLILDVRIVLSIGLELLGIPVVEKM